MLYELRIVNLGVISDANIEFSSGMTVFSGETGAGKTMIVNGLGLLLGERADAGSVRHLQSKAIIEGRFTGVGSISDQVEALGGELEAGELLATRIVQSNGRSRALLGGVQVPLSQLDLVMGEIATIYGQSEQLRLGAPERQREVVDAHGGEVLANALAAYRSGYEERKRLSFERDELIRLTQERRREIDLLNFGLAEIKRIDPQAGEDSALAEELSRLQAIDDLRYLAASSDQALAGSNDGDLDDLGAVGLVGEARKLMARVAMLDPKAASLASNLAEVSGLVNDAAAEVASYLADLEADPIRLEAIGARQAELADLTRKYGATIDEVLVWAEQAALRLGELTTSDGRIDELTARLKVLDAQIGVLGAELTALRAASAADLAKLVRIELEALAMQGAQVLFKLEPLDEPGPMGCESVHLLLSANPGATPAPLAKVASGGELSRIRLAIEVVLADVSQGHTFVFDEVDAGVGGAVALEVGRRLARLAHTTQVIVVTHLAQVAVFADRHYLVTKSDDGAVTISDVVEVDGEARLGELARMMGGRAHGAGLEHARELFQQSRSETEMNRSAT